MSENSPFRLGPQARELEASLSNGSYIAPTHDAWQDDPDAHINQIRPEMYAIGALICADAIDKFNKEQITDDYPFGLTNSKGESATELDKLVGIREAMIDTFDVFTEKKYQVPPHLVPAARRLEHLIKAARQVVPEHNGRYKGSRYFMLAGYNTAIYTSLGAQVGISALLETSGGGDSLDAERFSRISNNSLRKLAFPIALDNIEKLRPYERALFTKTHYAKSDKINDDSPFVFNPNLLELVGDIDNPKAHVDFLKAPNEFIDPRYRSKIKNIETSGQTLTCPGSVKLPGYDVAIKTIWEWTTKIYSHFRYGKEEQAA